MRREAEGDRSVVERAAVDDRHFLRYGILAAAPGAIVLQPDPRGKFAMSAVALQFHGLGSAACRAFGAACRAVGSLGAPAGEYGRQAGKHSGDDGHNQTCTHASPLIC